MVMTNISRWLRNQIRTFIAQLPEVQLLKSGLWDPKPLLIIAVMLTVIALPAFGKNTISLSPDVLAKLSPELQAAVDSGDRTVDVIVQFSGTSPDKIKHAGAAGAVLKRSLKAINGANFTINVKFLGNLASLPEVAYVSLDRPLQMSATTPTPSLVYPVQAVNADQAWGAGYNGAGIGVAVIDSGVTDRLDLHDMYGNSRVVYNESFLPGVTDANDYYGHGTHVAGIVGGDGAAANFNQNFSGIEIGRAHV